MIILDGSMGEGGGQILRSALTLAILTRQAFKLEKIRYHRDPPGLKPQHVASIKAAAMISGSRYKGASVGSDTIYFEPGEVVPGKYHFAIGSAGATSLVLQTVALPLALRGQATSEITITGGTHVSTSPSFHFLATTWAHAMNALGMTTQFKMTRPGFYPRGGGEIHVTIEPSNKLQGISLMKVSEITTAGGFSAVAGLAPDIAKRICRRMSERLKRAGIESYIPFESWTDGGPGAVAGVVFRQTPIPMSFFAIGERGKPAESVADDAIEEALAFRETRAAVDPHLADQILLPMVFAENQSQYRVSTITQHLLTNMAVIQEFLPRVIQCDGEVGQVGTVTIPAVSS